MKSVKIDLKVLHKITFTYENKENILMVVYDKYADVPFIVMSNNTALNKYWTHGHFYSENEAVTSMFEIMHGTLYYAEHCISEKI